MSRDRRPARKPARAPAKSAGGTLIGIFIGLVFGALIAAGAAWYFTRSNPFQAAPVAPRVQAPAEQGPAEQGPAALPGKPGDRPVAKQDFEFYRILPQGDNVPSSAAQVIPVPAPQVQAPPVAVPAQQAPAAVPNPTPAPAQEGASLFGEDNARHRREQEQPQYASRSYQEQRQAPAQPGHQSRNGLFTNREDSQQFQPREDRDAGVDDIDVPDFLR